MTDYSDLAQKLETEKKRTDKLQRKADALDKVFQHKQLRVVWETPDEATGRFPIQRTLHTIEAIESVPALEVGED